MSTPGPDRPNVLLIMTDQQRFDFVGYAGASFLDTPNIDRIARGGMRFNHAFTPSPICAPARVSLANGIHPARFGAVDNEIFLPVDQPNHYQRLRDHEYHVGYVGKLDTAKPATAPDRDAPGGMPHKGVRGDRPVNYAYGFTHPVEVEGKGCGGKGTVPSGPYTQYLHDRGLLQTFYEDFRKRREGKRERGFYGQSFDSALPPEAYQDAWVGRTAVDQLDRFTGEFPWYFTINFLGPHPPFDPPSPLAKKYRQHAMPSPIDNDLTDRPRWHGVRYKPAELSEVERIRRQYCACIEAIDQAVGDILELLERRGWTDNTCILFSSDHGEMLGDHGMLGKSCAYEPSVRVPLAISGPGIKPGTNSDALVELSDLNPTVCDLAGIGPHERLDARSIEPILRGQTDEHRQTVLSTQHNFRMVRDHQHKLVVNFNDRDELYDLHADPRETRNLIDEKPEAARPLRAAMKDRLVGPRWLRPH